MSFHGPCPNLIQLVSETPEFELDTFRTGFTQGGAAVR